MMAGTFSMHKVDKRCKKPVIAKTSREEAI
jgi:hypothetical protein